MRIAIIGWDENMPAIVESLAASGHEVTRYFGDEIDEREIRERFPGVAVSSAWESLLSGQGVDLAIFRRAIADADGLDQARRLIQHGVPVVLPHPISHSAIDYYELDMVHRESGSAVWFDRVPPGHPAIEACAEWIRTHNGPHDAAFTLERTYDRDAELDWETQFTRDLGVLDGLDVRPRKISALADSSDQLPYFEISLGFASGRPLRWTLGPGESASGRLMIEAAHDRADLLLTGDFRDWTFRDGDLEVTGNASLRWPLESLAGKADEGNSHPVDNCAAATRDIEILEAARKSLARGRVVELSSTPADEETTFKGIMAASGCVLLLGVAALLFAVAIGQQVAEELKAQRLAQLLGNWPMLLLGVLAVFLFVQGLLFVARRRKTSERVDSLASPNERPSP